MISITNEVTGDVNVVKLVGRLDVKSAREAETALTESAEKATNVVLDMAELDYIASAGLRMLKRLRSIVLENGGTLKLRNVQENVMEIFEMTGFVAMLTFE